MSTKLPKTVAARIPRRGRSINELAELMGVTPRTARRWAAEPREVYLARSAKRHERIRELRAEGLTMREIAARVGVTVGAVHYALKRAPSAKPDQK